MKEIATLESNVTHASEDEIIRTEALNRKIAAIAAQGDFVDGVARMLLLLMHARGYQKRSEMDMTHKRLAAYPQLASLTPEKRKAYLDRQSVIIAYQPEIALATLPRLFNADGRKRAVAILDDLKDAEHNDAAVSQLWRRIRTLLHAPDEEARHADEARAAG